MPNRNYEKGVRFERFMMEELKKCGFNCTRASGSHSAWDVIGYRIDRKPIFGQCKVTSSPSEAKRLIETFKTMTVPSVYYHQALWVKTGRGADNYTEVVV